MDDFIMSHHWSLALIGAHFIPYALIAFGLIAVRLLGWRMRLPEVSLLLLFVGFIYLEYMQLSMTGSRFAGDNRFGMRRYYGAIAPVLWVFSAKLIASVWWLSNGRLRIVGRVIVCLCLAWVLVKENFVKMWNYRMASTAYDTRVAVEGLKDAILEDYAGPREQREFKRSVREYFSGRRPVVSCPYGAAGWAVRGDHCRTTGMQSPYREDYLCFPLGSGYAGITNIDEKVYKYITSAPGGHGTHWMLFRRRTTPGRR